MILKLEYIVIESTGIHTVEIFIFHMQSFLPVDFISILKGCLCPQFSDAESQEGKMIALQNEYDPA